MTNKRTPYILMAAAAVIVIWLPTILFKFAYHVPDDYLMNHIANGSYSGNTTNLIYPQLIYGFILNALYSVIPSVNWYGVIFLVLFTTDIIVLFVVAYKLKNKVAMVFIAASGLVLPMFLTFTVAAYITIAAGLCLTMYFCLGNEKKMFKYIFGALLIIVGYMIRGNTVLTSVVFFVPLIAVLFLEKKIPAAKLIRAAVGIGISGAVLYICTNNPHAFRGMAVWACIIAAAAAGLIIGLSSGVYKELFWTVFIVCIAVIAINAMENLMVEPAWKEFREYTRARAGVLDYPHSRYERVKDGLQSIGISEAGNNILFDWVFADKKVFSTEAFVKMREVFGSVYTRISVKAWIKDIRNIACVIVPIAAAILLCFRSGRKERRIILVILLFLAAMYTVLIIRHRFVYRVTVPLGMICMISMFIASGRKPSSHLPRWLLPVTAVICAVVVGGSYIYYFTMKEPLSAGVQSARQYIEEHQEEKFIVRSSKYNDMFFSEKPILTVKKENFPDNAIKSGGGDAFSPRYYDTLRSWELANPDRLLMQLVEDERVRYVDNEFEDLRTYLEEQSGKTVTVEIEKSFGDGLCVYKFSAD